MKKNIVCFSLFFCLVSILSGCDCQKFATGKVYDSETLLPLDSVLYDGTNNLSGKLTNSKGEFVVLKMAGRRCKIVKVKFNLPNYKPKKVTLKNHSNNNVIFLKKEKVKL
jgi:hypothetical protein